MPLVQYIGSANSYARGRYRFIRENDMIATVADADVKGFIKRAPENRTKKGHALFEVIDEADVTSEGRAEEAAKRFRIGEFHTKADAVIYAEDEHKVILADTISLKELNEQTLTLHKRAKGGAEGADLIRGLRGAKLVVEPSEEGDEITVVANNAAEAVEDDGEDDDETGIDTAAADPKPVTKRARTVTVKKPGKDKPAKEKKLVEV